jgi:hypothetical protein
VLGMGMARVEPTHPDGLSDGCGGERDDARDPEQRCRDRGDARGDLSFHVADRDGAPAHPELSRPSGSRAERCARPGDNIRRRRRRRRGSAGE